MGKLTGAKIKEARTAAKLTQEALAQQLDGITASDISKAERGDKELTQAVLKKIAKITGVTQASLLNAEKEAEKTTAEKKVEAAKTSSAKTSAAKSSAKPSGKTDTAKAADEFKLTAAEKTLVELYRKADADTKKAVINTLKGEKNEMQELIGSLLGDALGKFLK